MKLFNKLFGGTTYNGPSIITPGTKDIIIPKNTILSNDLTILGDSDLVSNNIKEGIDIFGITGSASNNIISGTITASSTTSLTINHNKGSKPSNILLIANSTYDDYYSNLGRYIELVQAFINGTYRITMANNSSMQDGSYHNVTYTDGSVSHSANSTTISVSSHVKGGIIFYNSYKWYVW